MDQIEICAEISYVRPLPYYLAIDTRQTVMGFVHGDCPPDEEFQGLEQFRQAVIRLAEEGLSHPEGCEKVEEPFVRVTMKAGPDHLKPTYEFDISAGFEEVAGVAVWVVHWNEDDASACRSIFPDAARALDAMKSVLDQKTGKWASEVVFESKAPGSQGGREAS